jgi:DNA-binding NtrC family response regulator
VGYGRGRTALAERVGVRSVVIASADANFRERLREHLTAMRWQVREAGGGAEAVAQLDEAGAEALLVDSALPDLDVGEFAAEMRSRHPSMDLLRIDGAAEEAGARSPRRNELLHALRQAQEDALGLGSPAGRSGAKPNGGKDAAAWVGAPVAVPQMAAADRLAPRDERALAALDVAEMMRGRGAGATMGETPIPKRVAGTGAAGSVMAEVEAERAVEQARPGAGKLVGVLERAGGLEHSKSTPAQAHAVLERAGSMPLRSLALPEMVGESAGMREMARLVRLVAPRSATVLIEGETGTGKELVAKAVHRLSARAGKPFVVLNCAAIPETLLEAELFGHTRGAFTGAVQSRTGRIEAAHGGTLFLDEIGEMPLALQAKMLRFLESGELQRVGDNEMTKVDVRVVAATHQPLKENAAEKVFRLDLYHRLAVFPVAIPALREHMEDLPALADYLLGKLGETMPVKRLGGATLQKLMGYSWPGNVRELEHVLERGAILAEERMEIGVEEIRF